MHSLVALLSLVRRRHYLNSLGSLNYRDRHTFLQHLLSRPDSLLHGRPVAGPGRALAGLHVVDPLNNGVVGLVGVFLL